jgi:mono/diheme cytochrome c family protein
MLVKILKWLLVVAVLIQFIPYGHQHTNPPGNKEPAWDAPNTRELFRRACFDCHTNTTTWPWYSHVAPVSWLVQNDVDGGRRHLNFSEWDQPQRHAHDIADMVNHGAMPPWFYLPMHAAAKLSDVEKKALVAGAERTFGPQDNP